MDSLKISGECRIEGYKASFFIREVARFLSAIRRSDWSSYILKKYAVNISDSGFVKNGTPTVAFAVFSGLVGNTGSQIAAGWLAVGTSNTAFVSSQTTLVAEITDTGFSRAAATVARATITNTNDALTLTKTFTSTGSKTIEEAGVFNAASSGVMLGRTLTGSKTFANGESYVLTYRIKFS